MSGSRSETSSQAVRDTTRRSTAGQQRSFLSALRALGPYLKGLKRRWMFGLLAAVGAGLIALAIPQVLGGMVDGFDAESAGIGLVWAAFGVVVLLGFSEASLVFLRRYFVIPPSSDAETSMRTTLFSRLVSQSASFHSRWDAGQLQSRAIADLNLLRRFFAFGSLMLVSSSITIGVGLVVMFVTVPLLGGIFLLAAVPVLVLGPAFRRRFIYFSRSSQDQAGEVANKVEESVHGIRVLKAFGRSDWARESFVAEAETLRGLEVSKMRALAQFQMFMVLLPETILAACIFVGLWQVSTGGITQGNLVAFFATAVVLKGPIEGIGMLIGMVFMSKTAIDRHIDVMEVGSEIHEPQQPQQAAERGLVQIQNVHFRYPDAQEELLRGVDLEVQPGETMALVSATGGGTSTLLSLIPRLYDVTAGSIRIDGVDIRELTLPDLRSRTAIAYEDPTLFSASVRSNVLLATSHQRDDDDASHPYREAAASAAEFDELLAEALHTADAEFAENLPDGVDTAIGEEGLSLSGGQRQRLALARAIAAKPSVLLLDDPLSAVDVRTEERVTERLREVLRSTTTLIVAHRPSTVALADRVAVLHDGVIHQVGTHSELLERSDMYRSMMKPPAPTGEDLMNSVQVRS